MRVALPVRLMRASWPVDHLPRGTEWAVAAFAATFVTALLGLRLQADGIAVVWPVAGAITGLLTLADGRQRFAVAAGALLALCLGNFHAGRGLATSLVFMAGNVCQGLTIGLVLEGIARGRLQLNSCSRGLQFALVCAVGCGMTALAVEAGRQGSGHDHYA